jgi:hypothetical protein
MLGPLNKYLEEDHDRLDDLLNRAFARPDAIDRDLYGEFRQGLLRHIAMEEKVLLPAIARLQRGVPASVAEKLRLDHGALAALLVPPPTPTIIATLRSILRVHNALEERDGGVYQLADHLAGAEAGTLLQKLKETPQVPVMPHNERPEVMEATRRAVERAGYRFVEVA